MQLINRDCLVLKAKQTFVEWIRMVPGLEMPSATLDDVNIEGTILLVPERFSEEDAFQYIEKQKPILIVKQFADWYRDDATWPDFNRFPFDHWISVEYHSMVYDMAIDTAFIRDSENELNRW